ncbi:hypothetical protein LUZ61_009445 [Rhynchospora tenuis]|uniref:Glutathione S-transferase n=1 Tax=Rhynchospora tenuis TaxID=198213 RepID=A0AAD5ZXD1_9POAL|nr:hypothetical protein LUZ61_009445 [Rhynchospora tenuis]
MAEPKEIKLFGAALSGYATLVHHTLRLKGILYDYINVDLKNKSEEFLRMNPVHKKVPVLVVDGKPIPESLKSKVRFWADFIYQKIVPQTYVIQQSEGEAQKKAVEELFDLLGTLEEGVKRELHVQGGLFINGPKPGLLDIILGACRTVMKRLEGQDGLKLLDEKQIPLLCSLMDAYAELDFVNETDEMLSQYVKA